MARIMSLESGLRLWRLNQELLPEPGSPIASTTVPLEMCGLVAGGIIGAAGDSGAVASAEPEVSGAIAAGCAAGFCRERLRPRPPRRRRGRRVSATASGA